MSIITPYYGYGDLQFNMSFEKVCETLNTKNIKYRMELWPNKGCTPEVPWNIIRIDNTISIFFAKGKMFKIYFENTFNGVLQNGIGLGVSIEEALKIDQTLKYDDWEEEYVSEFGYWLEDDPETHRVISISIFIKELEDDNTFYRYEWCNLD